METIMQRIQKALRKEFSSRGIFLEDAGKGYVGGWIISKSFEGLNGAQRQKQVWSLFDKYLDDKDRTRLAVFLTFTPLEKKDIFNENSNAFKSSAKRKSLSVGRKNGRAVQKQR